MPAVWRTDPTLTILQLKRNASPPSINTRYAYVGTGISYFSCQHLNRLLNYLTVFIAVMIFLFCCRPCTWFEFRRRRTCGPVHYTRATQPIVTIREQFANSDSTPQIPRLLATTLNQSHNNFQNRVPQDELLERIDLTIQRAATNNDREDPSAPPAVYDPTKLPAYTSLPQAREP